MKIAFYAHGGSGNHGCEALARTITKIIGTKPTIYTSNKNEDVFFIGNDHAEFKQIRNIKDNFFAHLYGYTKKKLMGNSIFYAKYEYQRLLNDANGEIAISIGGDNYCYDGFPQVLAFLNKKLTEKGFKTVLFGCSIEPKLLENSDIIQDMNRYSLITARESITYDALVKAGITNNTKLFPDPAFTLNTVKLELPENFIEGNTVGINVSPLIQNLESGNNITYKNYSNMIDYIINNTNFNIALIPHVIWKDNNDLKPLIKLYDEFKHSNRICLIGDHNCMELKGFISRCRMFIGARTHATIAAYSSCVPTLVVGYSVKAKGIAKDLFGTYDNYVCPVQSLKSEDDLINAFDWLLENEKDIRNRLENIMPEYIEKAWEAGIEVKKLLGD